MELRPGYEQTETGVIPEEWEVSLLDSVAKRGSGHTPDKAHPEYWDGQIKWISLQDSDRLDQLYIYDTAAKITPAGIANSSARMHPKGTVVLSRDAGVGKSAIMKDDMAVSQHFIAWQCGPSLNNHFLYYWLQSKKSEFQRIAMGNTIKTIGLPYFRQLVIPRPDRTEQDAIAAALSNTDALIESLEQLIAKKRQLKQGAMQELLAGKRRLPPFRKEWESMRLGELFTFKNGLNKAKEFFGHGTPIVNYMDVFQHPAILGSMLAGRVFLTNQELSTFDVRMGDVFFTRTSETTDEVGIASVVLDDLSQTVFSGFLLRARPKNNKLCNEFKRYCFAPSYVRKQIISRASYTTRALTNGRILSAVTLRIPEPDEQLAIAEMLNDIDAEISALQGKLSKARHLKQGMMQELLTGRTRLV
jgi:type I restriction enzyme S subunit